MANTEKEDRRITRTKSALNRAFLELIKEKGYASVTVEEITARANLGRTTFYLHYQDKEDLLLEGLEEQLTAWVNEITRLPLILWFQKSNNKLIRWIFQTVFETVKANEDMFALATQEQTSKLYERFHRILTEAVTKVIEGNPWSKNRLAEVSLPISYLIDYFAGAMWASIVWWASNEFSPSPDEMANYFRLLYFPGMLSALNVKDVAGLMESANIKGE
jgi:AcrR family transcriptional regulator